MIRWVYAVLISLCLAHGARGETRYALLIGNEDYPAEVGRLSLPHEDVDRIAAALEEAAFQKSNITILKDATQTETNLAVAAFASRLRAGGAEAVGFFYYSGHGGSAEVSGERQNYLIPARTPVTGAEQLPVLGVPVSGVIDALAAADAKAIFIVSDACRNTLPFSSSKGSGDKGMVRVNARSGLYIAFATADGATTPDDGLFSSALAEQIVQPGQTADRAFTLAMRKVAGLRPGNRLPFSVDGLRGDICFSDCSSAVPEPEPSGGEAVALGRALSAGSQAELEGFLQRFPESRHRGLVESQLAELVSASVVIPQPVPETRETEAVTSEATPVPDVAAGVAETETALVSGVVRLKGHTARINSVEFDVSGDRILTASEDGTARLWSSGDGLPLEVLAGHSDTVWRATMDRSGANVLTVSSDGTSRLWSAASGNPIATITGNSDYPDAVEFSPDGTAIFTAGKTNKLAYVRDLTGASIATLKGHTQTVMSGTFSPDGTRVLTTGFDGKAIVWDRETGNSILVLKAARKAILVARYSSDGKRIVTASSDRSAKVWDTATGKLLRDFDEHPYELIDAQFDPTGKFLVTQCLDGIVRVFDISGNATVASINSSGSYGAAPFAFGKDGRSLHVLDADGNLRVLDMVTGKFVGDVMTLPARGMVVAVNAENTRAAVALDDHSVAVLALQPISYPQ